MLAGSVQEQRATLAWCSDCKPDWLAVRRAVGFPLVNGVFPFVWSMFIGFLLIPGTIAAQDKVQGHLIVEDILARPGTAVTLKAVLLEKGFLGNRGLGGETVTFTVQGQHAGTALTGGDGRAFLEFKTHMRGNHKIVASLESSPRVEAADGNGNLASWERRRPILLVDFATLVQEEASIPLPDVPVVRNLKALGPPQEHAAHELSKVAEFYYNVIYVCERQGMALHETREWLRRHEFPVGIARTVPLESKALVAFMETLKEGGWDNLEAAIGRTWEFAQTLVKNRVRTVIFPDSRETRKYPRRAKIVNSWKEVRKQL